jgi:hypothetical protein
MHIIEAKFEDIDEITVGALFGAIGAYVIWSAQAERRPSYIGEGKILRRFADEHIDRFGTGAEGVVTVMDGNVDQRKRDAEIVESALFIVSDLLGLSPTHNKAPGKWTGLQKLHERGERKVRIRCSGCHPLRLRSRISGTDVITLHLTDDGEYFVVEPEHPWRRS